MKKLPRETLNQRIDRLVSGFEAHKPDGVGPFPTIIMLHGCGRADMPQAAYVEACLQNGIGCIVVDSYAPRQISIVESMGTVCTGVQLWGRERAGDLVAALAWAKTLDWVDASNISALGWSHGGWTIMDALALEKSLSQYTNISDLCEKPLESLKSVFLIYPWCGPGSHSAMRGWNRNLPAHMIVGGRDLVSGEFLPKRAAKKLKDNGVNIEVSHFDRATHGFDEPDALHPAQKYDPELTERATEMVVDFVKAHAAVA